MDSGFVMRLRKTVEVMTLIVLQSVISKIHIDHVNHGTLNIYRGVGVSSTFLAVMRCSLFSFLVLRYTKPPNVPLLIGHSRISDTL